MGLLMAKEHSKINFELIRAIGLMIRGMEWDKKTSKNEELNTMADLLTMTTMGVGN